jgi:hypothetical protein
MGIVDSDSERLFGRLGEMGVMGETGDFVGDVGDQLYEKDDGVRRPGGDEGADGV